MWMQATLLIGFLTERASFSQMSQTSGGLAEHDVAVSADDDILGVGEHRCDLKASRAFHIHEERIRRLHHAFQLVLSLLAFLRGIQQVHLHDWLKKIWP